MLMITNNILGFQYAELYYFCLRNSLQNANPQMFKP